MTNTNERQLAGSNTDDTFTVEIRDTEEHDLPDVEAGDPFSVENRDVTMVKVVNNLDAEITATLKATDSYDRDFEEPYEVESVVVAPGEVGILGEEFSSPFGYYTTTAVASTVPETGELKMVYLDHDY